MHCDYIYQHNQLILIDINLYVILYITFVIIYVWCIYRDITINDTADETLKLKFLFAET